MKLLQSFLLGFLGALGALVLEIIALALLSPLSLDAGTISLETSSPNYLFFLFILIEEFFKYIFIFKILSVKQSDRNLVLNSLFLGIGFSSLETFLIFWNYRDGIPFDPLALLGIILLHASTAIVIGYALSKNIQRRLSGSILGIFFAFIFHSAFNLLKISENIHQKQLIIFLLSFLLVLDIFFLVTARNTSKKETCD